MNAVIIIHRHIDMERTSTLSQQDQVELERRKRTYSILLVEDDQDSLNMLKLRLQKAGFQKLIPTNEVPLALKKLSSGAVDLIVSDWNMPGLQGIDLLKQVRLHDPTHGIPFIMLTANADKNQVEEAIQSGVNDYHLKTSSIQGLIDKINTWLMRINPK